MADITKLQDVKDKKKLKIINEDLVMMIKLCDLSLKAFTHYKRYLPVQEILNVLKSNKTLLEIHLNKTKKGIENL